MAKTKWRSCLSDIGVIFALSAISLIVMANGKGCPSWSEFFNEQSHPNGSLKTKTENTIGKGLIKNTEQTYIFNIE